MSHQHTHPHSASLGNAFKIGIALNVLFIAIELAYGLFSNSMALIADAGHNMSDVLALAFSWVAVVLSKRKATHKYTYGFRRSTILIALLNTILLLVAVAFILWETIERLGKTEVVNSSSVIVVAAIGIVVNGVTALLFIKGKTHDLNIRSAFVHFVADALVSLGVVIAGVAMAFSNWYWIDSVMSFLVVGVILYSTYHLLIDSVNLALDAVPENIEIEAVRTYFRSLPEVEDLHDLHIWSLSTTEAALTVHLITNIQTETAFIGEIQLQLKERFGIEHSTLQIEFGAANAIHEKNCN